MKFLRRTTSGRQAEVGGDDVDEALEVVGGFRPPRAAVGGHRGAVGEDTGGREVDVLDVVDADAHEERQLGNEGEDRIGAHVRGHAHAERGDGAVPLHRRLQIRHLGAAVGGRGHVLVARLRPAHGDAEADGR